MQTTINVLAGWVLIFMLAMRSYVAARERGECCGRRPLRLLLAPSVVALVMFVALSAWLLVGAGYILPAILLVAHVWWFFDLATDATRAKDQDRSK